MTAWSRPWRTLAARLATRTLYGLECLLSLLPASDTPDPHAVALFFHGIWDGREQGDADPQERVTAGFLLAMIRAMKAEGYTFVSPGAVLAAERPAGNLAVLTSDDGYRSIESVLPMLEAEQVPLAVFVCPEYARRDGIHWWDQVHPADARPGAAARLKHGVRTRESRDEVLRALGFRPDTTAHAASQRLLSPGDLARLQAGRLVHVGNHTNNHLSLPLVDDTVLRSEIEDAGRVLEGWIGLPVVSIAFPYGDYDERVLGQARRSGYRLAFTTEPGRVALAAAAEELRVMPRYQLRGDRSARWQARIVRRGVTAGTRFRTSVGRRFQRQPA